MDKQKRGIFSFFGAAGRFLRGAAAFLFGRVSVSYRLPPWLHPGLSGAFRFLGRLLGRFFSLRRDSWALRAGKLAVCLAAAALLAWGGWSFFRDRSGWVSFKIEAPAPTPLARDAAFSVLALEFSDSAAAADLADKAVAEGIVLKPALKGSWRWEGDNRLVFSPAEDWACGTDYSVDLAPSLFREGMQLYSHTARFSTEAFKATLSESRFELDQEKGADRRVRATLVFNYPVDAESLKDKVELRVAGGAGLGKLKTLRASVGFDEFLGKAFIVSEALPLPKEASDVEIRVDSGIKSRSGAKLGGKLKAKVQVPGLYDLVAWQDAELAPVRNDKYEYEQTLTATLTGDVLAAAGAKAASAWILPADRLGLPGYEDEKDHEWTVEEVDRNVLSQAEKAELKPLPAEREASPVLSFTYKGTPGRWLYVSFAGKVPAWGGYVVKEPYRAVFKIPEIPKALDIMHDGSILSLSGAKTLSVVSNDVATLRFRACRLFPDQVTHLITQTFGDFAHPQFENDYAFNENDMSVVYEDIRDLRSLEPGAVQYSSFDFSSYLKKATARNEKYGLFLLKAAEYDKEAEKETGLASTRFVLVTDLGLLAKRSADGSWDVFVQDLRGGRPRAGAEIEALGRNGAPVAHAVSDAEGRARFPDLSSLKAEKQAVAFAASAGGDFSFLPLAKNDRLLQYSRFDVGGERGASRPDKLSAFVFSDRGLYRPGDTARFGWAVKAGDWGVDLAGLPLELRFYDPRGVELRKDAVKLGASGFGEAEFPTSGASASGRYRFDVSLVKDDKSREYLGGDSFRVEDFTPDRLSVGARIEGAADRAWLPFGSLKATVKVMNLYGSPAAGNEVHASFRLSPRPLSLSKFPDYLFQGAAAGEKFYQENLAPKTTDASGEASFDLDLAKFEAATFSLDFDAEGLEKSGGRGVDAGAGIVVSPLDKALGWKADGRLDYIAKGSARSVRFVVVDPLQKPTAGAGYRWTLDEVRWVSVLTRQEDKSYRYQSARKTYRLGEGALDVGASGLDKALATDAPGDFELVVADAQGRPAAKIAYSVAGAGNLTRSLDRNAELQVKLDKESYEAGDEIEIRIVSPYSGSGLITIERDKVYAASWFRTDSNASVQRIRVPGGLEGGAYVNVAFVRGLDSRDIYMSPLSSGVVPFKVSSSKRSVAVKLDADAEAKPGKPFAVRYKADRPAKIVVWAADEGILQPARYQTPDPLGFFFKKRALEVDTSQILDQLLPEFSVVQELMKMGGDADGLRSRQNPFKRQRNAPVAFWSGVVDADKGERVLSWNVPAYFNGALRVMAVAVAPDALGAAQRTATFRNDFILAPTLPAFLSPGDRFKLGVSVSNQAPTSGPSATVTVGAAASGGLSIEGGTTKTLSLARGAEGVVWFDAKAPAAPGAAKVSFSAGAEGFSSDLSEGVSVRPALPWRESVRSGVLKDGSVGLPAPRDLLPDYRKLSLSLSFRPAALNAGLLGYLYDYPYGCSEQLVSRSFPALVLLDDPDSGVDRTKASAFFEETVRALKARQDEEGGIGYWGANQSVDPWVTAYAAHFLTEAASRGWKSGEGVRRDALEYLAAKVAGNQEFIEKRPAAAAYAAWVLALNGKVSTNLILDARAALEKRGGAWKKEGAALYLAGAYAALKQQAEADKLLAAYGQGRSSGGLFYESELQNLALRVYMNARYRSDNAGAADADALERMLGFIGDGDFSTVSAAWAVLALRAYGNRAPDMDASKVEVYAKDAAGAEKRLAVGSGKTVEIAYGPEVRSLRLVRKAAEPLYWQLVQTGFDAGAPGKAVSEGIEVYREFQDEAGKTVAGAVRGQKLTAVVRLRSTGNKAVGSVAVTDLLPGGFELALDRGANKPLSETITGTMVREHAEAREDRVLVFGEVGTKLTEFRYPVKAATAGTFVLPAASAEAMYDRRVRGQSAGGSITVSE